MSLSKTPARFAILLLLMLLVGCGSNRRGMIDDINVRTGSKGLEMRFVENSPPRELYENSNFLISFEVLNQGAETIQNGMLALGLEDDSMQVVDWQGRIIRGQNTNQKTNTFEIEGKSQDLPEGDMSLVSIRAKTLLLDRQTETRTSNILVTACYAYKTLASQDVCVDPDVYKTKKETKVCEVQTLGLQSQGAPLAITRIEPLMLESEDDQMIMPQFMLTIRNVGNGEVFDSQRIEDACTSASLAKENLNLVRVSAKLGGKSLQCTPQPLHLSKKENLAKCTLETGVSKVGSAFISPLVIELDYGYSFTISKSTIIKRLGK